MVKAPVLVDAGVVVQAVIPAVPDIAQVTAPVGALDPVVPVTVVINVRVELSATAPLPVSVIVGVNWPITTVCGAVVVSAV